MGTDATILRLRAFSCSWYVRLMAMYTVRSITHSLQSVIASTEAALGELYSSANSPKPLHQRTMSCRPSLRKHLANAALDLAKSTVHRSRGAQNHARSTPEHIPMAFLRARKGCLTSRVLLRVSRYCGPFDRDEKGIYQNTVQRRSARRSTALPARGVCVHFFGDIACGFAADEHITCALFQDVKLCGVCVTLADDGGSAADHLQGHAAKDGLPCWQ